MRIGGATGRRGGELRERDLSGLQRTASLSTPLEGSQGAELAGRKRSGLRAIAAVDAAGTLVRHLAGCQEAPCARQGVEALADYLDHLRALQLLGPPEVQAANDLGAIVAGVEALMGGLLSSTA